MRAGVITIAAALLASCLDGDKSPSDGGPSPDAGPPADAGDEDDAGPLTDAGPEPRSLNDPCDEDEDCAELLTCVDSIGQCKGETGFTFCETNEDCVSNLCDGYQRCADNECDLNDETSCTAPETVCTGGPCGRTCEPPAARGEECLFRSDDNPCPRYATCEEGLVCAERGIGAKFGDGRCAPETDREVGEPCQADTDCLEELSCNLVAQQCE